MHRILLVPGWASSVAELEALESALCPRHRPLALGLEELVLSAPGSPVPEGGELSPWARGLLSRLEEPCVLLGWSMGGMVAMEAAAAVSHRIRGLILVSTTPRFSAGPGFRHGFPEAAVRSLQDDLTADPRRALLQFFETASGEEGEDFRQTAGPRVNHALSTGIDGLHAGLDYLLKTDLRNACARLAMPALVIHGRRDAVIPWRAGKWLADAIPHAKFALVADAPHDLLRQGTRELVPQIDAFLDSL